MLESTVNSLHIVAATTNTSMFLYYLVVIAAYSDIITSNFVVYIKYRLSAFLVGGFAYQI